MSCHQGYRCCTNDDRCLCGHLEELHNDEGVCAACPGPDEHRPGDFTAWMEDRWTFRSGSHKTEAERQQAAFFGGHRDTFSQHNTNMRESIALYSRWEQSWPVRALCWLRKLVA